MDKIEGETLTIHQYLKARKRRTMRTISHVLDEKGVMKTGQTDDMNNFTERMTRRFSHIPIDERRIQELVSCGMTTLPMTANAALEEPITMGKF
jgi:predicted ester cyclase